MNEVNKTLFIPLYGKAKVSKQNIILKDKRAEEIWDTEGFPLEGKSKSKWLTYNLAMRGRIYDDWTDRMLVKNKKATVIQIGCGLDSRYLRVKMPYQKWVDCDLTEVIEVRRKYFMESENYQMMSLNASDVEEINKLPEGNTAIVVLEGFCMYLTNQQLYELLNKLQTKFLKLHILMDIYTEFGARASKYKNPVNDVGVSKLYGLKSMKDFLSGLNLKIKAEYSLTPNHLISELKPMERILFRLLFTGSLYRKIYRLYELSSI